MARKRRSGKKTRPSRPAGEPASAQGAKTPPNDAPSADDHAKAETPETAPEPLTAYDRLRENIEALVVAVILAVIIRHFAVEAFEIPTGSMAPTLYGIHAWSECPNCETEYAIALRTDQESGDVDVPYGRRLLYKGTCRATPGCGMQRFFLGKGGAMLFRGGMLHCTACAKDFAPEASGEWVEATTSAEFTSRCPLCHLLYLDVLESSNITAGHKILVTKFTYTLSPPERFDVIVFTFDQWKNYIKRLVGKPGERIDVWDGDIYIDGRIERKYRYPKAQESLWQIVSDSNSGERGIRPGNVHPPAWSEARSRGSGSPDEVGSVAKWNAKTQRWSVNAAAQTATLEYRRGFDNFYSYNLLPRNGGRPYQGTPRDAQVGDKRVEFTVRHLAAPGPGGATDPWVGAEIREGDRTFQVRIPVGKVDADRPAVLAQVENEPTTGTVRGELQEGRLATAAVAIEPNRTARIVFENLDDRVAVWLAGELVLEHEYQSFPAAREFPPIGSRQEPPPMPSYLGRDTHAVRLLVADSGAEISDIQVYRDMYYIGQWDNEPTMRRPQSSFQLGERQYFAMGDNGPSSSDSRYWQYVTEDALMGRALLVFWPALPGDFQWQFIR